MMSLAGTFTYVGVIGLRRYWQRMVAAQMAGDQGNRDALWPPA